MPDGRTLGKYLKDLATEVGAETLEGAIVHLALDRPVDDAIRYAQALGPYHPGTKSPWSHTILLAEPYHGQDTAILDCTIRDKDGKIPWKSTLKETAEALVKRVGGIYDGKVKDYVDQRVPGYGVAFFPKISAAERKKVVAAGRKLQKAGYHYDVPGLVRELIRLATGIAIPAGDKLLFCSAFCQAAYRDGLGALGDFCPGRATADVTPDDLWFSPRGARREPVTAEPVAAPAPAAAPVAPAAAAPNQLSKIEHVVVVMFENRSFDHMLGYLKRSDPRVNGLNGDETNPTYPGQADEKLVKVSSTAAFKGDLRDDPGHEQTNVGRQMYAKTPFKFGDPPTNRGFVWDYGMVLHNYVGAPVVMKCFAPGRLTVLETLAREFAVCDMWFSSVPGPTWPNRFFVHCAQSKREVGNSLQDYDMPTVYRCLERQKATWAVYYNDMPHTVLLEEVRERMDSNVHKFSQFFEDVDAGTLPSYSFIEPRYFDFLGKKANDQHPPHDVLLGEQFLSDIYNALRASKAWKKTLLVVLWDEHGGTYDHVVPPAAVAPDDHVPGPYDFDFKRLGLRVPAVIISPLIPKATVDHTVYDHTSVLATLRERFRFKALTKRDKTANSFGSLLSLSEPRQDTPLTVAALGSSPRTPEERALEYAPLEEAKVVTELEAGLASATPLSGWQKSLLSIARNLDGGTVGALSAAALPTNVEHEGAAFVRLQMAKLKRKAAGAAGAGGGPIG